jgi:hypothetical protein
MLVLASLLLPAPARAQVSFTGVSPSVNFGSQAIGTPSAAQTLNFSIDSGTTVGSIGVLTQGAANLDFANAEGSTCTAATYVSAAACTVNVTFTPGVAGLRMGAVVFFSEADNTGTVLANVPVYGVGAGPQIAYSPGTATATDPTVNGIGLDNPWGVVVDAAGDLFVADVGWARVIEVLAGGSAAISIDPMVNGSTAENPVGVAVDGAGDLFISEYFLNLVVELPAGGGTAVVLDTAADGIELQWPMKEAVDGAGNLFVLDRGNNRIVESPASRGTPISIDPTVNGTGLYQPSGVAVDGAGDLFIADDFNHRIVEVPAGGGAATAIYPTVYRVAVSPWDMAVDGAGDLFFLDSEGYNFGFVELPADGGTAITSYPTVSGEGLNHPMGIAVDGAGDLFIGDYYYSRIVEIQRSQPPALNFPTVTAAGSTDTTDGTQTVQIQNIGNQPLIFTALSYPADFSPASGDANACASSTSLSPGQECDLPIQFTPQNAGALTESVTLTDNALNGAGAQQSIGVTGTGTGTLPSVATPTFSVSQGAYYSAQTVTVGDTTPNATIYCAINAAPMIASSSICVGPITVSSSETLEAIATASGYSQSAAATAVYTINPPQAATPTVSVAGGSYTAAQTVTVGDATPNATIYCAINAAPTIASSNICTGPITVSSSETLEAIATASGYSQSAAATAVYTINIPANPAPFIGSMTPAYVSAGGAAFTLTVNGEGFTANSTVYWGTAAVATTYVSAGQLTAQVPATSIASGDIAFAITVQTPAPGGGTSDALTFEVDSAASTAAPPIFTATTAIVSAGTTASYTVTLPSNVTALTISCLNLPPGTSCSYSSAANTVTIATSPATPTGTYQVTVVFNETVSGTATSWILLPTLLLPLALLRRKLAARGAWTTVCLVLVLLAGAAFAIGCGGGGGSSYTPPPPPQTHHVTSSGVVSLTVQ